MNFLHGISQNMKVLNMEIKKDILDNLQIEYNYLLCEFQSDIEKANKDSKVILRLLDEIRLFWNKYINLIEFELDNFTSEKNCMLFSGASYLDVKESEHYYFTLFGDYHVISDPLLKLETFFRNTNYTNEEVFDVFKRAYYDTLKVTQEYHNTIHVLPIEDISYKYEPNRLELFDTFYWRFVSTVLDSDIKNDSDFSKEYKCLSDVENNIDKFILSNLIFTDPSDANLPLEERCEIYKNSYPHFQSLSNIEAFKVASYSRIAQTLDIILTSVSIGFIPYIRDDITFRYFLLLKDTFINDDKVKKLIENTVLFHIVYKTLPTEWLIKYNFKEFIQTIKPYNTIQVINQRLDKSNISILNSRVEPMKEIIHEEIAKILKVKSG